MLLLLLLGLAGANPLMDFALASPASAFQDDWPKSIDLGATLLAASHGWHRWLLVNYGGNMCCPDAAPSLMAKEPILASLVAPCDCILLPLPKFHKLDGSVPSISGTVLTSESKPRFRAGGGSKQRTASNTVGSGNHRGVATTI